MEDISDNVVVSDTRSSSPLIIFTSLIFLFLGIVLGYGFSIVYPFDNFFPVVKKTCTPRPPCLDATPHCMIPETPDMCPRVTPTSTPLASSSGTVITKDELGRYQIKIPGDWKQIEHSSNFQNVNQFQAPDGSIFTISILDSGTDSLTAYLAKQDKTDLTSWEGQTGRKVISTSKTTVAGLPAVKRVENWLAADFITLNTYALVNNTVYSFYITPLEIPYDQTEVFKKYQPTLDTFEPLGSVNSYSCPKTEWVDCMPGPNEGVKLECTGEFLQWAKANCPGFQGAAL